MLATSAHTPLVNVSDTIYFNASAVVSVTAGWAAMSRLYSRGTDGENGFGDSSAFLLCGILGTSPYTTVS